MNRKDIQDNLIAFFQSYILYNEPISGIDYDEPLIDNGYIDSIGIIMLVSYIEKTFNFKVYDNEIIPENFESINSINKYVNNKITH